MGDVQNITRGAQLRALLRVARFRPVFTGAIILGGVLAALLEGVGLGFILPIIEIVRAPGDPAQQAEGIMAHFVATYQFLQIPFTLGTVIVGVSFILTVRWTLTFFVRWLRGSLKTYYQRDLQKKSFHGALDARVEYFDHEGSDDILNAIVTQARQGSAVISTAVNILEQGLLVLMYLMIALYLSPILTLFALALLGGFTVILRYVVEPGYELGDQVAQANEDVQRAAQAGTQGIRDTKLFGLKRELLKDFLDAVDIFATKSVRQHRNKTAIKNFYNLLTAVSVFALIYLAIAVVDMSLGSLGVFLFAMFQLGPKASNLNSTIYRLESRLPHLVRTQRFIDELERNSEPSSDSEPVPDPIQSVTFDNVKFSYGGEQETALDGISFEFERGEFIGFVGQSGAGKSTIVSLLTRMYEPDIGEIRANGRPIQDMDIDEWRTHVAVVRQKPFIFNDTLRYNLTIGNRDASYAEIERVARIAKIDEFFDDLPEGYDTQLGDEGVKLSGGQRQRVALARALLKDADVLVLDEATSDLDSNLEKEVQSAIEEMDREYAIVGIAHRLSTVKNADRIYTVDSGEIVEKGDHTELINRGGQYAELYTIQS